MLSSLNRLSKLWRFADANRVATVKVSSMVEAPRKLDKKSYRKLKQETELSHAMERDPVVTKFLVETEPVLDRGKRRKQAESFWTYLSTYKTDYTEKTLMIDKELSAQIADGILRTTERGADTAWIDAEGGYARVTAQMLDRTVHPPFPKATICLKDPTLRPLLDKALAEELEPYRDRIAISDLNFNVLPALTQGTLARAVNFEDLSPATNAGFTWSGPPAYTLFSMASLGAIKSLTILCMRNKSFEHNPFAHNRPEFFLVVSPFTWLSLNPELPGGLAFRKELVPLFRIFFEYELVDTLPEKSFFPWRVRANLNRRTENLKNFYLIRIRPRKDPGISKKATRRQLHYFLYSLYFRGNIRVIPLAERWLTGVGAKFIMAGLSVNSVTREVLPEKALELFNLLAEDPEFPNSNFLIQYGEWKKTEKGKETAVFTDEESEVILNAWRKKYLPETTGSMAAFSNASTETNEKD